MATQAGPLAGGVVLGGAARGDPAAARRREQAIRQARRELFPGVIMAMAVTVGLGAAQVIDVSAAGKAMLLFGTGFLTVVLFSAFFHPRWYLPLAVAYLPFSRAFPVDVPGLGGVNMTNCLLALGLVAWLATREQARRRVRVGRIELLVLLFVAVGTLSLVPAFIGGQRPTELGLDYRTWIAPILFFFVARGLVRDREDVSAILTVLAFATVVVVMCTWWEGIDRGPRGSIDSSRVRGLMQQANSMGAFLAYYGAPLAAFAAAARTRTRKLAWVAAFLIAARVTLYTFSRGAYLAFMAASATVLLTVSPVLLVLAAAGGLVSTAVVPSLVPSSVRDRLSETSTREGPEMGQSLEDTLDRSSAIRLIIWTGAARMIAEHPLQGVGLGRFALVIRDYTGNELRPDEPNDAHNAYILMTAEMGLPALGLFLSLLLAQGLTAARVYVRSRHPVDRLLSRFFLGSLAAVVVSCMLGSRFSDEALIAWFWILGALVVLTAGWAGPVGRRRTA